MNNNNFKISNLSIMPVIENNINNHQNDMDLVETKKQNNCPKPIIKKIAEYVLLNSKILMFFENAKNMQLVNKLWYRALKECINEIKNNKIVTSMWDLIPEIGKINFHELFPNIQCKQIPLGIGFYKKLEILNFSKNAITQIPEEMIKLSWLQVIDLSENAFNAFPMVLIEMYNKYRCLREINIGQNKLPCFPKEIYQLEKKKNCKYVTTIKINFDLADFSSREWIKTKKRYLSNYSDYRHILITAHNVFLDQIALYK